MAPSFLSGLEAHTRHFVTERLRPGTDEFAMIFYQLAAYWLVAGFYELLDTMQLPFTQRYKLIRRDPGRGNSITRRHVLGRVLLQQTLQTVIAVTALFFDSDMCTRCASNDNILQRGVRFVLGMFVMDAWQYWVHRTMHVNTFLYKHLHSTHHALHIPYAYGALYNSIVEGLVLDTGGGLITHYAAGLDCKTAAWLFVFANIKTVVDHSNYRGILNPLHSLFPNGAAVHDAHHDVRGIKMNFSQPFFTHWDWIMGTFLDPVSMHLSGSEIKAQQKVEVSKEDKKKR